jgi:hypothetical protein
MTTRICALSLTAGVALIGAALVLVPLTARTAAQAASDCAVAAAAIDPGYGVNQPADPQACGAALAAVATATDR